MLESAKTKISFYLKMDNMQPCTYSKKSFFFFFKPKSEKKKKREADLPRI